MTALLFPKPAKMPAVRLPPPPALLGDTKGELADPSPSTMVGVSSKLTLSLRKLWPPPLLRSALSPPPRMLAMLVLLSPPATSRWGERPPPVEPPAAEEDGCGAPVKESAIDARREFGDPLRALRGESSAMGFGIEGTAPERLAFGF